MIKRTYEELEPYFPAGHFGVTCKRYHGAAETGAEKFWIGISEFDRHRQGREKIRHGSDGIHQFPAQ